MKKILIFSLSYFPKHVGGAEVAIKEKTDRMRDIEFHLICLRYDSTLPAVEKIGNVLVHRIGFSRPNPNMADLKRLPLHLNKFLFQFLAAYKAIRLHRKHRYDAAWAMMAHSSGVPAALFTLWYRIPLVLELQEGDPPEQIEAMMRPVWFLFKRAFTHAAVISVISNFLGAWARRMGFTGTLVLIPNAVDVAHFSHDYTVEELAQARQKLGKRPEDTYLVTASRLVYKNGLDDVIRALKLLPPNVHFIIFGTGPDEAVLKTLAQQEGVEERIQFRGHVGHNELPLLLKACDIFIRPSRSEGMGNSFIEAMAAGIPVIATHEGGIPDFLFDERRNPDKPITGWAVNKDSPEMIAEAVKDICARPHKVAEVTANALALVRTTYEWDQVARDMRQRVFGAALRE